MPFFKYFVEVKLTGMITFPFLYFVGKKITDKNICEDKYAHGVTIIPYSKYMHIAELVFYWSR